MSKTKKIVISAIAGVLLLAGLGFGGFYFYKLNKVVTILTMDINPSLKLSLNYKNEVIKAEGLNEDGKKLLKEENFKGDDLEDAIEEITEKVIEKGYITEEDNHILINVKGKNIEDKVVKLLNDEFKENNKECNVIKQDINETAKENALKYNISDSKASYIQDIIKENADLKFEDLKDKSINEINQILNNKDEQKDDEEEKVEDKEQKEEEKKEENKQNNTTNNNNSNSNNNSSNNASKPSTSTPNKKPVSTPPASNDRTGAWCEFYKTIPPEGGVEYETPGYINDTQTYVEAAKKHMPADASWSSYFSSITEYRTASYCSAGIVELENYDKDKTYTMYLDSVTLEVLELKTKDIVKPNIDEAGARPIIAKWLMDTYSVDINDCDWENYYYAIDGSTKIPEWQYTCKIEETRTYYAVTVVATDGTTKTGYTWTI